MQARQGDIWFETCKKPKGNLKPYTQKELAYGEVSGHCHKIMSPPMSELESYVDEQGDIFVLSKTEPIEIGHEEHGSITLPKNEWFCVTRQREYDPVAAERERRVAD